MSKYKLLLADDSVTIQKVVNLTFADEGIEVTMVGDGDSALKSIEESRPDIVLADIHMPGTSGYQICESIRNSESTRNLPVILLVGSFEPFDEAEFARVGANAYLTKPFHSIRELVSTVNDFLRSGESTENLPIPDESSVPSIDEPDTSDIDSLYEKSFYETIEIPRGKGVGIQAFDDAGMDDEIIQSSYAEMENQIPSQPESASSGDAADHESQEIAEYLSAVKRDGSNDPVETFDAWRNQLNSESPQEAATGFGWSAPLIEESDVDFSHDTLRFDEPAAEPSKVKFHLDESDILELPSLGNGRAYNLTLGEGSSAVSKQAEAVSLSPELIDAIVRKVVEKLAERQ